MIPQWRSDRDYYGTKDPRRAAHLAEIETRERIGRRIDAVSADGDASYSVLVERKDLAR